MSDVPGGTYRDELFARYDRRNDTLDPPEDMKLEWFERYAIANYLPLLTARDPQSTVVLEIGCSRGYLLAVLRRHGYARLHGVDASTADVAEARELVPDAELVAATADSYLAGRAASFDVVLMKAVLEHIPKPDVLPLLRQIAASLKDGGVAIIDVPNMDWIFASHERYMDFTHEGGFTRESLQQTLTAAFGRVELVPVETRVEGRRGRMQQRAARWFLDQLLSRADPEGAQNPIWARSLIGVAYK